MRWLPLLLILAACGGKDPVSAPPPPPPPAPPLHDPEIYFHFRYQRDSAGKTVPYADTAVMRWYEGSSPADVAKTELAQVEISGTDSSCAYFLVAKGTLMYFDLSWRHKGTLNTLAVIGPFNPADSIDHDSYWDVAMIENTDGSTAAEIMHNPATSFCPKSVARDSVAPAVNP